MKNKEFNKILEPYLQKKIWKIENGVGSFLTIEMGDTIETVVLGKTHFIGATSIWIYLCDWDLSKNGQLIANSFSINEKLMVNVEKVMNQSRLLDIIELSEQKVEFIFENDIKLTTFCGEEYNLSDDYFNIFIENNGVISYSKEKGFYTGE